MPLERFAVPHGMPPVVVSGAPYGPGDPVYADRKAVGPLLRSGGLVPDPEPPKAAKARQEVEA